MKTTSIIGNSLLLAALFLNTSSYGQYSQATTGVFAAGGTNPIEKDATTEPHTRSSFSSAVLSAYNANIGGVFDFPTSVTGGNTVLSGTYGVGHGKRLQMTSTAGLTPVISSSTLTPISNPAAITTAADTSNYSLMIARPVDVGTGQVLPTEAVTRIGFAILSRTHATYPCDIQVTVSFDDGSTQVAQSAVGNPKTSDDTFFGFAALEGRYITNVNFRSFASGTVNPVNTRIGFDDFGFITSQVAPPPPPNIVNLSPLNHAIHEPTNGIQFQVQSYLDVAPGDISLVLNSVDVSNQLFITGDATNHWVSFSGLVPNEEYTMMISAANASGPTIISNTFYTATSAFTLFDSEGFTSDEIYPYGALQNVTHGRGTWLPNSLEPAEIENVGGLQGKVLKRLNTGVSCPDYVHFPPVSSGTLIIEFDAWVSTTSGRTFDISLAAQGAGQMGSFLVWGEIAGKLAYHDNVNWLSIADLSGDWQHFKIVNYLSGPAAGKYDVFVDDIAVAEKLAWRNAPVGTSFGQLRYNSQNTGPLLAEGKIDNLVITAGPEDSNAFPPPSINNLSVSNYAVMHPADGLEFTVSSGLAIATADITLLLNGTDVSSSLQFSGSSTNRSVSYDQLVPGRYTLEIIVSNDAGSSTLTRTFIAAAGPFTLFDSGGFSSPSLYPEGPLQAAEQDGSFWTPATDEPAEIVYAGETEGKVLRRTQMGVDRTDMLNFPLVASGILTIEANVRVSLISARTLDICLLQATGGNMASFLGWGTVEDHFAYFNVLSNAWVPLTQPGTSWHKYTTINYLSGPYARTFDLKVNDLLVGEKLPFRHNIAAGTPVGRIRFGAIRGSALAEYGEVDNLVLKVQPLSTMANPVSLTNIARTGTTLTFSFTSQTGFDHVVEYTENLGSNVWVTLQTITGDGSVKQATDNSISGNARYYRIRTQ
ncbi:MAG: hypothetical protein H0X66_15595 [Verrucomicrobia bacterium]|nr:hypothetical protein [Verrucomicrobiota bacterium]